MNKNKYGYKICYRQQHNSKLKIYLITNTYASALWHIRWYENHSPPNKETKQPLENVTWQILPIKTITEYKRLWRGCPF